MEDLLFHFKVQPLEDIGMVGRSSWPRGRWSRQQIGVNQDVREVPECDGATTLQSAATPLQHMINK
jgi:hypothetical protein